jgi:hypothetical protein
MVPVRVVTSGADANGESRAITILDTVMELLDAEGHVSPTGWAVTLLNWLGTTVDTGELELADLGAYVATATFEITVRQN